MVIYACTKVKVSPILQQKSPGCMSGASAGSPAAGDFFRNLSLFGSVLVKKPIFLNISIFGVS